jgi:ribosomal-protein-alanine N-acetyltransferase
MAGPGTVGDARPMVARTSRLDAVPLGPEHVGALAPVMADPRVAATMGGSWTREDLAGWLEVNAAHQRAHGFAYAAWFERATGELVARGGLHHVVVGGRAEVEVGWLVVPDRWGEGFATELGGAAVEHGFSVLGLERIVAYTLPANAASRRVMDKLGFGHERAIVHAGLPHVLRARRVEPLTAAQ